MKIATSFDILVIKIDNLAKVATITAQI